MPEIQNSLFLDLTSYGTTTYATRVEDAYHVGRHAASETINVALTLPRANDPTDLLESDWAARQDRLAELEANDTLWSTYGASQSDYDAAVALLTGTGPGQLGLEMIGDAAGSDGYISSPESRTVRLQLSPADFQTLFGTQALAPHALDRQLVPRTPLCASDGLELLPFSPRSKSDVPTQKNRRLDADRRDCRTDSRSSRELQPCP